MSGMSLHREWQCNKKPFLMTVTLHFACSEDLGKDCTMCLCLTNKVVFIINQISPSVIIFVYESGKNKANTNLFCTKIDWYLELSDQSELSIQLCCSINHYNIFICLCIFAVQYAYPLGTMTKVHELS